MKLNDKITPGEDGDTPISQPSFVSEDVAGIDDHISFPGTINELRDPFRSAIITQFGAFIKRLFESNREIGHEEREALAAINTKLRQFMENCGERNNWAEYAKRCIDYIEHILRTR